MASLDLPDIQGFILRGYTLDLVRHFALRVDQAAAARRFLGLLVSGDPVAAPQVTTAAPWSVKPDICLNLALTGEGLRALRVPAASLASFPAEFLEGAAARADRVGDTGESAPSNWIPLFAGAGLHLLLSLFAQDQPALASASERLRELFGQGGALAELDHFDGARLPNNEAHFGFADGIAQPNIDGAPGRKAVDLQPISPAGAFLLGFPSQFVDFTYPVPQPEELGRNGSFAAFRVLRQDVDAFFAFLRDQAPPAGISEKMLAAKFCGRWPNGVPLELSPTTDAPIPPLGDQDLNRFDYVPSPFNPSGFDDRKGRRCPVGSHIRRANPRSQTVAGDEGHKHRIIRRGVPYGPPYDPAQPHDGRERGLLGLFIGVSLRDQFEFLMAQWINDGIFTAGLGRTKDPIMGDNTPETSRFVAPEPAGPPRVFTGFSRWVITRGGAYCFLPSITALKHLAGPL